MAHYIPSSATKSAESMVKFGLNFDFGPSMFQKAMNNFNQIPMILP